jgi:AraC-like DNA-binding protein
MAGEEVTVRQMAPLAQLQMLNDPPLTSCKSRFTTSDPDVAIEEATKLLAPHQLVVGDDGTHFRAHASRAELTDTSLYYMDYRSPVTFYTAPQSSYVAVMLPITGEMRVSHNKGDLTAVPLGSIAVVPADCPVEIRYDSGFSMLLIRADNRALTSGLRRIAPAVDAGQPLFDGIVSHDSCSAGTLYGLATLIAGIVDRYTSLTLIPPNVVETLSDQIVSTFLLALPHNKSDVMLRTDSPIARREIRRALEILASEHAAENSVTDIALKLNISVRSLELGFRHELDCTPRDYIRTVRLEKAHKELRGARHGDGSTVTNIAMRWGFNHTGRFAALYRRVYGVSPSREIRDKAC